MKSGTEQKPLSQSFIENNDTMRQDLMLSYNESHGPLFQDAILNVKDLNAHKQEHAENELSFLGATSSFQDESAPPAAPARKAK